MNNLINILSLLFVVDFALILVWLNGKEKILPSVPYLMWALAVVTIFVVVYLLVLAN